MKEIEDIIALYARAYPREAGFFLTADKQVFLKADRGAAYSHQRTLYRTKPDTPPPAWLPVASASPETTAPPLPDAGWTVSALKDYLDAQGIAYDQQARKAALLALALEPLTNKYDGTTKN